MYHPEWALYDDESIEEVANNKIYDLRQNSNETGKYVESDLSASEDEKWRKRDAAPNPGMIDYSKPSLAHLFEDDSSSEGETGSTLDQKQMSYDYWGSSDSESDSESYFNQRLCRYIWDVMDRLTPVGQRELLNFGFSFAITTLGDSLKKIGYSAKYLTGIVR